MGDHSSFASYARDKQAVAETLRSVQVYFERQGREIASEALRSLLSDLAEDRFNLVVVGQFKRGKSSLINALLGRDVLPTAIVPLTSIITSIRYGPIERALVTSEGGGPALTVDLANLADFVTERGNPNNEKKVVSVAVEVPSLFLRRGLYLVDTPGIGSAYTSNTATTYAFLPEADAVIFVTSVESPLTEGELSFVDTIRQYVERVFFVLNKIDHASPAEQCEAVAFAERLLGERVGAPSLRLFPLSARQALEGKLAGDHRRVEESGLPAFEEALATFLRAERETTFLRAIIDRARRLLAEEQRLLALLQRQSPENGGEADSGSLGDYLNDLASARDAVLSELAARQSAFLSGLVAPAIAAFVDAERAALLKELESRVAETGSLDVARRYHEVWSWLQGTLDARRQAWLAAHRVDWQSAAREFCRVARHRLARATDHSPIHSELASLQHLEVSEQPPPFEAGGSRAAGLEPPPDSGSQLFSLPRPLAVRALRRRLLEDLDRALAQSAQLMRAEVDRYLEGVIDRVRRETDRALADLRRAAATPGSGPAFQSGDSGDQGGDLLNRARQVEALISRLATLRHALGASAESVEAIRGDGTEVISSKLIQSPADDRDDSRILESALRRGGCPVCTIVQDAVWEFLRHWQYALATDEAARQVFRADGGFCNEHTWALEAVASPRGLCAGYLPLLDRLVQEIGALSLLPTATIRDRLTAILPDTTGCRLCAFRRQREGQALRQLATLLDTADGRADYLRSPGLCLPHVQALLAIGVSQEAAAFLIDEASRHLSTAAEDMRGYALKFDARRRDLITPPEERSHVRVPALLAGVRESLRRVE